MLGTTTTYYLFNVIKHMWTNMGGTIKKESMTWPFNSSSRNPKPEGQYASLIKIDVVSFMIVAEMSHRSLIHWSYFCWPWRQSKDVRTYIRNFIID